MTTAPNVAWTVEPGYESVRDAFVAGMGSFGRGGGAYCAYVDGRPVVDLWGGLARPGEPWQADTAAVLMSATKSFASICLQKLVDRGQLDLEEKVSTYWPEFGQHGKNRTTVRQLLMHTAGTVGFDRMYEVVRHDGTGWGDLDTITSRLAESVPSFEPGTKQTYHALSIGWQVSELVRRIDGRTIGQFFAAEVAQPLELDAWIGLPSELLPRVAHVLDIRLDHLPKPLRAAQEAMLSAARNPDILVGRAFAGDGSASVLDHVEQIFNNPQFLTAEVPAGNCVATARAVAKCWAMVAGGGELDGVRVLSSDVVRQWSEVVSRRVDVAFEQVASNWFLARLAKTKVPRTIGHLSNGPLLGVGKRFGPNPNSYGGEGLGGQYAFCDPDANIAVGYVRSELAFAEVLQPQLTSELYRCANALGHKVTIDKRSSPRRAVGNAVTTYVRRRLAVPSVTPLSDAPTCVSVQTSVPNRTTV